MDGTERRRLLPGRRGEERTVTEGGRRWKTWQLLAAAGVAFLLGIGAGASGSKKDQTVSAAGSTSTTLAVQPFVSPPTAPPTTRLVTTTEATTTTMAGPKTTFGDGNYRVGIDIAAGTYRSSGAASGSCYWARLSNFTGSNNILANYLDPGPTTVTILASDAGFETRRCGTWSKV